MKPFLANELVNARVYVNAWNEWFEREGLVGRYVFRIDFTDEWHGTVHCFALRNGRRYLTPDREAAREEPFEMEFSTPAPVGVELVWVPDDDE